MSDIGDRARRRDEELRRRIEQGGIPVDHGIREEITPEQREEWAERTRRHADEEDKIIDKMRGRTPPTTKSFSGLLKSLRAKYGIKTASQETERPEQDASTQESSSQDILGGEGWEPLPDYAVKARMQRYDREPETGRTTRQWYSDRRGSLPMEDQSHLSEATDLITNFLVGPGKNPNAPYQADFVEGTIPRESGPKGPIFGYLMDTVRNDSPERLERIAERDDVSTPLPSPEEQYSSLMYLPKVPIVGQPQRPADLRQPHPNEIEDDVVEDDTDHPQEDDYKFYVPQNYGIKTASQETERPEQDSSTRGSPAQIEILESDPRLYGLRGGKSVTSSDGEELEDDPRDWEEFDKSQGKDGQEDQSKISEMVSEKSYSSQVPIPHGNLSRTNIPPVEWEPGVGAKALSELASFFKAMSDEKAFGQVHREKALGLLGLKGIQGVKVGDRIDKMTNDSAYADSHNLQTAKNPHGRPVALGRVTASNSGGVEASGDEYHPEFDDYDEAGDMYVFEDDGRWSIRPEDRAIGEKALSVLNSFLKDFSFCQ